MLIYSENLEKFIKNDVMPQILISDDPNKPETYNFKGSFKRKIPYVTDVDVISMVYPDINKDNIYPKLVELIERVRKSKDIIIISLTCGKDQRFILNDCSDEEIQKILPLMDDDKQTEIKKISNRYQDPNEKLFYCNEIVWEFYKIRWTPEEVINNKKILPGGLIKKFTDAIKEEATILIKYYVMYQEYPIGIDIVFVYDKYDMVNAYNSAAIYQLKHANYAKEYYFMLFPFKYYFRHNKKISNEITYIIENKYGMYKQLLVLIDTYRLLYATGNLNSKVASNIMWEIVDDAYKLPDFKSNIMNMITRLAGEKNLDYKLKQWDLLLEQLYKAVNNTVNFLTKKYFFKYLNMVPANDRSRFYINLDKNNH